MARILFEILPSPGHTKGSISLLAEIDGRKVAFCGDLIAAPGMVHRIHDLQWGYNQLDGLNAGRSIAADPGPDRARLAAALAR